MSHMRVTYRKGFTLVELLIAIGVFSVVVTLTAGAYLIMIGLNRQAQAVAIAADNLSFSLENMVRSIRTASDYSCGGGDCSAGESFSMTDSEGRAVTYTWIHPVGGTGSIQETVDGSTSTITDPNVNVTNLTFNLQGSQKTPTDYVQPFVKIIASGSVNTGPNKTFTFSVETAAVMRGIDI